MLLPFQGVLGRYRTNPGHCPGLFAFGLSARIISIIVNTFLQSGLKAQPAHSPGYSEAAPWVCMPMIVNALEGQKHNNVHRTMLLPFQGVLGRYHINPGRCPGLFAFALAGRIRSIPYKPRALPWAICFWAFSPYYFHYSQYISAKRAESPTCT